MRPSRVDRRPVRRQDRPTILDAVDAAAGDPVTGRRVPDDAVLIAVKQWSRSDPLLRPIHNAEAIAFLQALDRLGLLVVRPDDSVDDLDSL